MNFWLVKQEPSKYSWEQFVKDKKTYWDGVRNYQARLKNIALIKQSRLSVIPLSCEEFKIILKLAKTKLSNF